MWVRIFGLIGILFLSAIAPPSLGPKDARLKIEEILKTHVTYHQLDEELIKRAFKNYLDEIDPSKTYLLYGEILKWIDPKPEFLAETVANIKKDNFTNFENLHDQLALAMERRSQIEEDLQQTKLPQAPKDFKFKDLDWTKDQEELSIRIANIRALQLEVAEKIDVKTKDYFVQRLEKMRKKREEELLPKAAREQQRVVLSITLKSVSEALDSHTTYFTPAEANQFMMQVQQRLFGIGALLRDDLTGFTIVRLLDDGPAKASNQLYINDKIIAVNHEPVFGMELAEAVELIRGPKGTSIILTILREHGEGEEKQEIKLDVKLKRDEVVLQESRLESSVEPFADGVIGIFHLHAFYQDATTSSAADLAEAIENLQKSHTVKGIILDLRYNGGGLLPQAVAVTSLFIKKGIVVSVKDNTETVQHLRNINENPVFNGPLIVLTNKISASASEIVAQTLQDYGRALVIGDPMTYGKGTFQTFTLETSHYGKVNPKGEFKVTRGRYYTVSGKSPQLVGVIPRIIVPGIYSEAEIGERYSKYPLANETIPPNFEDTLSDVDPLHRRRIASLYKFNMQNILTTYEPYVEILENNSKQRISQNKSYQNFIKELSNKDSSFEKAENYSLTDLQLLETCNIMKDLLLLQQIDSSLELEPLPAA